MVISNSKTQDNYNQGGEIELDEANGSRYFLTLSTWTLDLYLSGRVTTENYQKKSTRLFNIQMKKI